MTFLMLEVVQRSQLFIVNYPFKMPSLNRLLKFALAALIFSLSFALSAEEKPRLILLTVKGKGLTLAARSNIRVAIEKALKTHYTVYSGSQVDDKIEREFVKQCRIHYDDAEMASYECMKEVAGFFVADYIATPQISPQDGGYLLTLEIRDAYTSESYDPYSDNCIGCKIIDLADAFRAMILNDSGIAGTPVFINPTGYTSGGSSSVVDLTAPVKPQDRGQLALLLFDSVPSGAEVWLGDIKAGTTPYQNLRLSSGQNLNITLKAQDHRDLQVALTLQPGSNTPKPFELTPAFGSLSITSEPSGADVYLSGKLVGQTPYSSSRLASAKYLADIRKPLYLPLSNQTIAVEDGKLSERSFKLEPNFGDLNIASDPPAVTITLEANGREVFRGTSPISLQLEPATYILSASKAGYAERRFEVTIARGESLSISKEQLQLRQLLGTAIISSEPASPGARVFIDGKDASAVPLITELPVGSYEVTIKGDKLSGTAQLQIRDGEQRTLVVELQAAKQPKPKTNSRVKQTSGEVIHDCHQCPQMVYIPASSFRMGDIQGGGDSDEKPVHRVSIKAFLMSATEVTFAQWDACVAAGGCSHKPSDRGWGRGSRPVINVSWKDITEQYIPWLNKKNSKRYRLPTEAEWEYAARAGSETKYSWGNSIGNNKANCDGCGSRWDYSQTAPVASFAANAFGLYDMHGNVREWTQDCWNSSYKGAPSDGTAWLSGDCGWRVLRGSSWFINPIGLRSANRGWYFAGYRDYNNGFRLAKTLD